MRKASVVIVIFGILLTPAAAGDATYCLFIGTRTEAFLNLCNRCTQHVHIEWEDSTGSSLDSAGAGGCTSINPHGRFTYCGDFQKIHACE